MENDVFNNSDNVPRCAYLTSLIGFSFVYPFSIWVSYSVISELLFTCCLDNFYIVIIAFIVAFLVHLVFILFHIQLFKKYRQIYKKIVFDIDDYYKLFNLLVYLNSFDNITINSFDINENFTKFIHIYRQIDTKFIEEFIKKYGGK